jgi:hypothetical protein
VSHPPRCFAPFRSLKSAQAFSSFDITTLTASCAEDQTKTELGERLPIAPASDGPPFQGFHSKNVTCLTSRPLAWAVIERPFGARNLETSGKGLYGPPLSSKLVFRHNPL